jgi:hypothetical protein
MQNLYSGKEGETRFPKAVEAAKPSTQRMPQMMHCVQELNMSTGMLVKLVEDLQQRLSPVLMPRPCPESPPVGDRSPMPPLVEAIVIDVETIDATNRKLRALLEQIEL